MNGSSEELRLRTPAEHDARRALDYRAVLASLFDAPVAVACEDLAGFREAEAEAWVDPSWCVGASPSRRRELARGRACAARALEELGAKSLAVGRGPAGEPLWPAGAVGSITHADGVCAAVVARAADALALGVDVEPDRRESRAFLERMCSAPERAALAVLAQADEWLAVVVFSAKEASYKLQFPLTGDAECWSRIEVLLGPGEFLARFHGAPAPLAGKQLRGRWRSVGGFVWTGVELPGP